jgi:hypothetical protein
VNEHYHVGDSASTLVQLCIAGQDALGASTEQRLAGQDALGASTEQRRGAAVAHMVCKIVLIVMFQLCMSMRANRMRAVQAQSKGEEPRLHTLFVKLF